jgi:hypothetical protein
MASASGLYGHRVGRHHDLIPSEGEANGDGKGHGYSFWCHLLAIIAGLSRVRSCKLHQDSNQVQSKASSCAGRLEDTDGKLIVT